MLKNNGLYDPIERTRDMEKTEFTKYVEIREKQMKANEPTDPETIEKIRQDFYHAHEDVAKERLDEMWGFIGKKVNQNAGLAQFILDYGGAKSGYFFPWLKAVFTSPSAALEMAYNAGYNLDGEWVASVPETDEINFFVRNDPTFVYNRERQLYVADLVTTVQKKAAKAGGAKAAGTAIAKKDKGAEATETWKSKVVDLGAGRMAWARWHGFKFDPEWQTILAGDMDSTIVPEELFPGGCAAHGVSYKHADMRTQVMAPECQGADLVILGGVATYYPLAAFTESVIRPIYGLLKTGGGFFFDLQVMCPYLMRSMRIFDWPEMRLQPNAAAAIEAVENVRSELWKSGMKFSAEYALDTYNEMPTAVMITFTKL